MIETFRSEFEIEWNNIITIGGNALNVAKILISLSRQPDFDTQSTQKTKRVAIFLCGLDGNEFILNDLISTQTIIVFPAENMILRNYLAGYSNKALISFNDSASTHRGVALDERSNRIICRYYPSFYEETPIPVDLRNKDPDRIMEFGTAFFALKLRNQNESHS